MTALAFGGHDVDLAMPVAALLAVAAVLATARLLYRQWRADPTQRSRAWRVALLVLAQPVCATLLYFALLPPTTPGQAGTLVVATAGAAASQLDARRGDALVAVPEAPSLPGIERVPDLATALRRHPGTQRVRVIGAGLEARDRDAVRGLALEFQPVPLPRGLVELDAPPAAVAGAGFRVSGRAQDLRGGFAELLDPGRRRVDRAALADDGRFTLAATTRVPGAAVFGLRLRDARQRVVEDIELPLQVDAEPAPRLLLLAGAPGPEIKFLRRWARDAGLSMHTQVSAGGGMQLGDAPIALNAGSLSRFDLVVLDERAWTSLGDAQRAALAEALRGGLGVLLRVTAALPESERRRLQSLGFAVEGGRDSATIRLEQPARDDDAQRARMGPGTRDAPRSHDAAIPEIPALTRRTLRVAAPDAIPLLRDEAGAPLALWRAEGRGRIAVWTLTDSYRLVLAGRSDLHGEMWSDAIAVLARARTHRTLTVEGELRPRERVALCGVATGAHVIGPGGTVVPLRVDPATGTRACAAFWPREAGWHRLRSSGHTQLFHVRAAGAARGLHASAAREATLRLAAGPRAVAAATALPVPRHPGARWPWWLAWLSASAGVWWLERSRAGRSG